MSSSSDQTRTRNDLSDLQSSRIADLTRRLENAATSTGAQQSVRFPIRFIEALLRTVTPVDSSNLIKIIPIIDQNKGKLIQILHTNSSRCLAYLLLGSSASSDQESGLHFLLDLSANFDYSTIPSPESTKQSSLTRRKLIEVLCSRFLDDNWERGLRRLAGKLLLEIFLELQITDSLLGPGHVEYPYHRFVSVFCSQADTVLRFFAGSVLRVLYLSDIKEDKLWPHDNTESRSIFFNCLRKYPEDWSQAFHSYIHQTGHHSSVCPERNGEDKTAMNSKGDLCYSVTSARIDQNFYQDGFMLAFTTGNTFSLIPPSKKASQQHFNLIEVPLTHISDSVTDAVEVVHGRNFRLQLKLDTDGIVIKDGKCQVPQDPTICLVSEDDLTDLWTRITSIQRETKEQIAKRKSVPRRPSSIIIPLDTGEELALKSAQYRRASLMVNDEPLTADKNDLPATSEDIHQSLGDGKDATPANNGKQKELRQATSDAPSHPQRQTQTQNGSVSTRLAVESNSVSKRTGNPKTVGIILKAPKKSKKAPAEPSKSRQKKNKASGIENRTTITAFTSEPLQLSRPHRAKRKVHGSNDTVDWDEDLRPTDDSEEQDPKDAEFTSVSTISPRDSPIVDRRNTVKKDRKFGPDSKTGSTRQQAKKTKEKRGNRKSKDKARIRKLTLLPRGSSADNESPKAAPDHQAKDRQRVGKENIQANNNKDASHDGLKTTKSMQDTSHAILSRPGPAYPCGSQSPFTGAEADGESVDARGSLDLLSDLSVFPETLWDSSAICLSPSKGTWSDYPQRYLEDDGLDWGFHPQTKAKAKRKQGRGGKLGTKLTAALLEADVLPDTLPQEDRSSSDCVPVSENTRSKHSEVFSPPEGAQSPIPSSNQQEVPEGSKRVTKQQIKPKRKENDGKLKTSAAEKDSKEDIADKPISTEPAAHVADNFEKRKDSAGYTNQKRVASDEPMDNLPHKKRRTEPEPEQRLEPEPREYTPQLPQRNLQPAGEVEPFGPDDPDIDSSSWVTTEDGDTTVDAENVEPELHLHPHRAHSEHTPTERKYAAGNPKPLLAIIVDENGSPRHRPRQSLDQRRAETMGRWHSHDSSLAGQDEQMDTFVEYYPSNTSVCRRLYFEKVPSPKGHEMASDVDSEVSTSRISIEQGRAAGLEALPAESLQGDTLITTLSTSPSETGSQRPEEDELTPLQSPMQLESELAKLDVGDDMATKWQTCLQTIQESTDDVLANTSKNLMHHIEREQEAISRVLELYLDGCHRVLDRLAKAQEERIEAYRQQLNTIQAQQAGMCRDLVRRLEPRNINTEGLIGGPTSD